LKLDRESLVLYAINLIEKLPEEKRAHSKDRLTSAMGISDSTLDLYMSRLSSKGFLVRKRLKYKSDVLSNSSITDTGREEVIRVQRTIDGLLLTEERHNIPSCIQVSTILGRINEPLEKIFFLSLYTQNKFFDLPMVLNTFKISKEQTNLLNAFCDMQPNPCGIRNESFVETYFNTSLYGKIDKEMLKSDSWKRDDIDALLVLAKAKQKMGKLEEVKMIHEYLLTSRTDLTQNQWFIIKTDQLQILRKDRKYDELMESLDELLDTIDNKIYVAFLKMLKGQALFMSGERKEYKEYYRSAISSFNSFAMPLFLGITYNNRGVANFIAENYKDAEEDWNKARKFGKEAKSEYLEAKVLPNLADINMMKGNFKLAISQLNKAKKIFMDYSDYDGIANVELNLALLELEKGDLEHALEHFNLSNTISFPLPSPEEKTMYRDGFIKRAMEKGFADIENLI
jgi:tetratricopeptide (TPR) repeat protein